MYLIFQEKLIIWADSCIEEYVTGVLCYWQQRGGLWCCGPVWVRVECSGDVTMIVGGPGAQQARHEAWANTGHTHGVNWPVWTTSDLQSCNQMKWIIMRASDVTTWGPISCQWAEARVHSGHNTSNSTGWHQRGQCQWPVLWETRARSHQQWAVSCDLLWHSRKQARGEMSLKLWAVGTLLSCCKIHVIYGFLSTHLMTIVLPIEDELFLCIFCGKSYTLLTEPERYY